MSRCSSLRPLVAGLLALAGCGDEAAAGDTDSASATDTEPASDTGVDDTEAPPTSGDASTSDGDGSSDSGADPTGDPDTPGSGCCAVHSAPLCDEMYVAECVCASAPECCVFEWYDNCVDLAMGECAATCMPDVECATQTGELDITSAVLSGGWELTTSQVGEGQIAAFPSELPPGSDAVTWTVPIPCKDQWYIWVRHSDSGSQDSFFVRLDGEPEPPAIFEGDCTDEPQTLQYIWSRLNWRANPESGQRSSRCEFLEDPWAPVWDEGDHEIALSYRDAAAVSRIFVTNDATAVPP